MNVKDNSYYSNCKCEIKNKKYKVEYSYKKAKLVITCCENCHYKFYHNEKIKIFPPEKDIWNI